MAHLNMRSTQTCSVFVFVFLLPFCCCYVLFFYSSYFVLVNLNLITLACSLLISSLFSICMYHKIVFTCLDVCVLCV